MKIIVIEVIDVLFYEDNMVSLRTVVEVHEEVSAAQTVAEIIF